MYEWVVRFQGGTDGTRFGLVAASYMYKDQTVSVIGNVRDSFGFRSGVAHMQDARLGLRTDNPPPRFKHGQRLVARLECGPGVFSARCDGEEAEGPPECVPLVEQLPRDEPLWFAVSMYGVGKGCEILSFTAVEGYTEVALPAPEEVGGGAAAAAAAPSGSAAAAVAPAPPALPPSEAVAALSMRGDSSGGIGVSGGRGGGSSSSSSSSSEDDG